MMIARVIFGMALVTLGVIDIGHTLICWDGFSEDGVFGRCLIALALFGGAGLVLML
jgi:hypothetical protein